LRGPYETHPKKHLLTVRDNDDSPLQRTGHGQYVELPDGTPYHTYLCTRPLAGRRSQMGRESGIARCEWRDDGWLYLANGGMEPDLVETAPDLPPHPWPEAPTRFDFTALDALPPQLQWLRSPDTARLFELRKNALRLHGRESIGSWFEQALVAARQTEWVCAAETEVSFQPESYQQMAGLVAYYNRTQFHYLAVTQDPETGGRALTILSCADWPEGRLTYPVGEMHALPDTGAIRMRLEIDRTDMQFYYAVGAAGFQAFGPVLDASILSDEGVRGEDSNFTGNFVGVAAQDLTGRGKEADFAYLEVINKG
jgi:xylan 1,4-beta-xylosidase